MTIYIELHAPLDVAPGARIENTVYTIASDFALGAGERAAIRISDDDVVMKNVSLIGASEWDTRWNAGYTGPGIDYRMEGIYLGASSAVDNVRLENLQIRGFPQGGIHSSAYPVTNLRIKRIRVTDCQNAISLKSTGIVVQHSNWTITGVRIWDMWGPWPTPNGNFPALGAQDRSEWRRTCQGGNGIIIENCNDLVLTDALITGDYFCGLKIVGHDAAPGTANATIRRVRCNQTQVQATYHPSNNGGIGPYTGILFDGCVFDKGYASASRSTYGVNGVQLSYPQVTTLTNCKIFSNGRNGHGLQAYDGVTANVTGCLFNSWNGLRFTDPAYAAEVYTSTGGPPPIRIASSINADFLTVNTFVDQTRLLWEH